MNPSPRRDPFLVQGTDPTRASVARVYDYSLGGKDNYEIDKAAYYKILQVAPGHRETSWIHTWWRHRAIDYLADAGVDQFLDIGAGLPTEHAPHLRLRKNGSAARVVYVDNDALCLAHGRALLPDDNIVFVAGDFVQDGTLLHQHSEVMQHLDPDKPIGMLLTGVLHHLHHDALQLAEVMREYIDRLPAGSYVVASCFWDPGDENPEHHQLARQLESVFVDDALGTGWFRSRAQILRYFDGLELVPPGLVEPENWQPSRTSTQAQAPEHHLMLCGVGRKTTRPVG